MSLPLPPFVPGLLARIWSGALSELPGLLGRLRHRRTVLEALAEVGPAGMTPTSLEVTTDLAEPLLQATLQDLVEAGLVCRQPEDNHADDDEPGAVSLTDLHQRAYLLTEHVSRS